MNTGMQDAFNLGWKLGLVHAGHARAGVLLDSYSAERSAVGDAVLRNAGAMTRVATLRSPTARHLRNVVLPALASLGIVQARLRDTFTELGINYRHGPLTRDGRSLVSRARAPVIAGDRAPDVTLVDARGGAPTTLFARFGTRHCLLLCAGDTPLGELCASFDATSAAVRQRWADVVDVAWVAASGPAGEAPLLLDPGGALGDAYGVRAPSAVLVRPDGYIGYFGQPLDRDRLLAYLASYLQVACS
jgi:hypothetical protein